MTLRRFGSWTAVPIGPSPQWLAKNIRNLEERHRPKPTSKTLAEVIRVNTLLNHEITYVSDLADHWQQPSETLDKGTGDCEDYAILKRAYLFSMGWKDEELLVVIAYDILARLHHAMLLVLVEGQWVTLDNRTDKVQNVESMADYRPVVAYANGSSYTFGKG